MAKVKHGNYVLQDGDIDLQDDPPAVGAAATSKAETAKKLALAELRKRSGFADLEWRDFQVTQRGPDDLVHQNVPVEWQATKTKGHGASTTTFTFIIDMDRIPPGAGGHGPDRPHIGYSYWGTGGIHATAARFNGHIFIEEVPASRNDPNPYR
jgi:hypothetical protein